MTEKLVVISNCVCCPYSQEDSQGMNRYNFCCWFPDVKTIPDVWHIPEWCPLPDKEDG